LSACIDKTTNGTAAAWTILQHTGRAVRSVLKVEDLTTRRVRVVASAALRPAEAPASFGYPQLAGPYLAWQRAILLHGRTPTGTIVLMNLATGQLDGGSVCAARRQCGMHCRARCRREACGGRIVVAPRNSPAAGVCLLRRVTPRRLATHPAPQPAGDLQDRLQIRSQPQLRNTR
jgi:hypothetical protein